MADTGVLVNSGTFRVDRKRALEKLKDFQLPDPEKFLLLWVRCAVESGAKGITLENISSAHAVEMKFDGRVFTAEELKDPFVCLFEEGTPENARNRNLAIGIMSVLRLNPKCITVTSGTGSNRMRLRVESLEETSIEKRSGGFRETILRVEWPMVGWRRGGDLLQHVRIQDHMLPIPIKFYGLSVQEGVEIKLWQDEQSGQAKGKTGPSTPVKGARIKLEVPGNLAYPKSVLRLHSQGVFVELVEVDLPLVRVDGWINDDGFALNLARSGVVRDIRFNKAMELAASKAGRLLLEKIRAQAGAITEVGRLIRDTLLFRAWGDWLKRGEVAETVFPLRLSKGLFELLKWLVVNPPEWNSDNANNVWYAARVTAWLREACERNLTDRDKDSTNPTLRALWETPIFLSVDGKPLSLSQLESQRRRLGHVPFSWRPFSGVALPYEVVWLTCEQDRACLSRHFPGLERDLSQHLMSLAKQVRDSHGAADKGATGLLERAGIFALLIRDGFQAGRFQGEVGLEMSPGERNARVVILRAGKQPSSILLDCGLRFAAAVERATTKGGSGNSDTVAESERREVQVSAMQAAGSLYRKLASEYDVKNQTPRNGAIHEHLLDYLVEAVGKAAPPASPSEQDRWVESVPLFKVGKVWLDFARLRLAYEEGQAFYLLQDQRMVRGLDGKSVLAGCAPAVLSRLLAETAVLEIPGKPGVQVLFKKIPKPACGHPASNECLIEKVVTGEPVCLTIGEKPGGQCMSFPWGTVTVFPRGGKPLARITPQAQTEWGMTLMIALMQRRGTLFDAPGDPARKFLLQAAGYYLAPWPGKGQTPRHRLIVELLERLPMFLRPDGTGWTVNDLVELRLSEGVKAWYLPVNYSVSDWRADLVLTDEDLALIVRLWPDRKELLVPLDPSSSLHVSLPPIPAPVYSEVDTPEQPSSSGQAPEEVVAAESAAQEPGVLHQAHHILLSLRGRRGMKLLGQSVPPLHLLRLFGDHLLDIRKTERWDLNYAHPLMETMLGSPLADAQKAAYLASLVYTAANRSLQSVTDQDDVKFQQALADHVTQRQ